MTNPFALATASLILLAGCSTAGKEDKMMAPGPVTDEAIATQRAALAKSTENAGFGPQAPRDLSVIGGANTRLFSAAPPASSMNLCNIHFHESAEHKGGDFTKYAGNGDGLGSGTGFQYSGTLTAAELADVGVTIGAGKYGDLVPGDTIEVHYVHTSAQVTPGPTLGACLSEAIGNPQLRVETQVMVLVNDDNALDFAEISKVEQINGLFQAPNVPTDTGTPIVYAGSTTGPSYNEKGSPFQVTWSVRPQVAKVSIQSVDAWLKSNIFNEASAHGVRNLVTNPDLLSPI
ncbi:MAG: delta-class carbonic anhydrase [Burkholderiaceae bacterium]